MPAHNKRFGATAAIIPLFPASLHPVACKPIKNATFAAENILNKSQHE